MLITAGTWWTPIAFTVSKNKPSLVLALPIVPHAISFPLLDSLLELNLPDLKCFDAIANPNNLGICPEVGEISDEILYCFVKSTKSPLLSTKILLKWDPICLPPDMGSSSKLVFAYNPEKNCFTVNLFIANIKVWSL